MTYEQKIEILSNEIRKALPYMMELSEGCIVEYFSNATRYRVNGIDNSSKKRTTLYCSDLSTQYKQSSTFTYNSNYYEIVGHEPMLNDVLAWLINFDYKYFEDTVYLSHTLGQCGFTSESISFYYPWNLEKPYLKEQSEELINFLYSLIKQ